MAGLVGFHNGEGPTGASPGPPEHDAKASHRQLGSRREGKPRLAHPRRPGEGEEADVLAQQAIPYAGQLCLAADQRTGRDRQGTPCRGKALRPHKTPRDWDRIPGDSSIGGASESRFSGQVLGPVQRAEEPVQEAVRPT
jgi:hypothetical protein